jgi:hypothetical protein
VSRYQSRLLGFTVRLGHQVLCRDGQFHHESLCGPGNVYGARLYKERRRAAWRASQHEGGRFEEERA